MRRALARWGLGVALALPLSVAAQTAGRLDGTPTDQGIVASAKGEGLGTWEAFSYASFPRWPRRIRVHWLNGRVMDVVPQRVAPGPIGDMVYMAFREFEVPGPVRETPPLRWLEVSSGEFVLMDRPNRPGWEGRYAVTAETRGSEPKRKVGKPTWSWVHLFKRSPGPSVAVPPGAAGRRVSAGSGTKSG